MADFKVLKKDGWAELLDFHEIFSPETLPDLWRAVGRGDHSEAVKLLQGAGYEIEGREVKIISFPDDRHGEFNRVWVKR
jgi:hypothetical protein